MAKFFTLYDEQPPKESIEITQPTPNHTGCAGI